VVYGTKIGEVLEWRGNLGYQSQYDLSGRENDGPPAPPSAQNGDSIDLGLLGEHIGLRLASRSHDDADLFRFVEPIERTGIAEVAIQQIFIDGSRVRGRDQAPNLASFSAADRAKRISMTPGITPQTPWAQLRSPNSLAASGRRFPAWRRKGTG
jgi:hypothetical protein